MNVDGNLSDALKRLSAEAASDPNFKPREEYQDEFPGLDCHVRDEGFQPILINIRAYDELCCEVALQLCDAAGLDDETYVPLCRKVWGGMLLSHLSNVQRHAIGRTFDRKQQAGMPESIQVPDTVFLAITQLQPVDADHRRVYPTLILPGNGGVCFNDLPADRRAATFYARGHAGAGADASSLGNTYCGNGEPPDGTTVFYNMHRALDARLSHLTIPECNKAGNGAWIHLDNGEMAEYQRFVGRCRHVWKSWVSGVPKVVAFSAPSAYTCALTTLQRPADAGADSVFSQAKIRSFASPTGLQLCQAAVLRWMTDDSLRMTLLRFGANAAENASAKKLAILNAAIPNANALAALPATPAERTAEKNIAVNEARENAQMKRAIKALTDSVAGFHTQEWRFARWESDLVSNYHVRLSAQVARHIDSRFGRF